VRPAEILALVGDNGAGKSTLIKVISGVIPADGGEMLMDGSPVSIASPQDAKRAGIETVYQDLALVDSFDAAQNIFLGREIHRHGFLGRLFLDHKLMAKEARAHLELLEAHVPSSRLRLRYMSGGQRQAVALGRAVGWRSRIIIMDEPTAALGVQESAKVLDFAASLRDRGLSLILISHNLEQVFDIADRVTVLRHGSNVGTRVSQDVEPDEIVRLITGADFVRTRRGQSRTGHVAAPPQN
jgi:ABC-type sugar transport system ATPase subunit